MMTTGSDMEGDSISAKTLTASSLDSASDKGDSSSRGSVLQDGLLLESYQPSIFIRIFVAEFNIQTFVIGHTNYLMRRSPAM
ncbi:hypothetical protein BV898_05561 [Hypsibius exemplaris]|uniref:Uncharacterized protein n=1 Tax=Hypsibius exemplaris TaxID=2072580 RepID=A0A1W0WZ86_HYPEX|nr:hypothetical protein BV898_05561 [Hypsibius exemplaris]